jgi:L-asparaginase II
VTDAAPLVRIERSGFEESVHFGDVAACDADGRLVAWAGDPSRTAFGRSSLKLVQAAVALEAIGEALPDAEVAVMCASHTAEPVHLAVVERLLQRAGLDFAALRCPPAWPLERTVAVEEPRSQYHNCSGKHAGLLLACVRSGWDTDTYPDPSHPLQQRIDEALGELTRVGDASRGVDGCGLPVWAYPVHTIATMYARLALPNGWGPGASFIVRAADAIRAEPYLVGGKGRVASAVMSVSGDLVVKGGAEGLMCAGSRGSGLGVAVKVRDGGARAAGPALLRALVLLELLSGEQAGRLGDHLTPPVLGGAQTVGAIRAVFDLDRA